MSYELSFSPEFFTGDGMFTDECEGWPRTRPQSVLEAADALSESERLSLARDVFGYDDRTARIWVKTECFAHDVLTMVQQSR